MADHKTTRELGPLSLRAEFSPSTLNTDKRTVQVTWTTGARVLRGFWEQFWEELSLDPKHVRLERLNNGAPLLDTHDSSGIETIIGVVESASLQKTRGVATVRFDSGPRGEDAMRRVGEGTLRNVSVGYRIHKLVKVEETQGEVPVYRAEDWEPYELSFVPVGADAGAAARAADPVIHNPCVIITRQETKMDETNTPTPAAPAPTSESPAVTATRSAAAARVEQARALNAAREEAAEEAIAAERTRVTEIRSIAKRSKLGETWATNLIEAGTSAAEAQRVAFEHLASADDAEFNPATGVRLSAGDDARDKFIRGASAWLFERTGKTKLLESARAKAPELFTGIDLSGGGEFRGMSPVELARESLERQGVKTRGMDRMRMIGLAFTHRSGSYQVAGDFAILLETALHKMLLGAYATEEVTWSRFCGTDTVPDFRASNRYRTGSLPSLPVVAEHEEYETGVIPDGAKYQISTERHGEMFSLSREAIINDDMGALANFASEFGRAAARTIENDVYALLAQNGGAGPTMSDAQPFFHSNRANVGTGAAISVASLDADRVLMKAQKDPSGRDFLSLRPVALLVPDSLEGTARVINDAQYDPDTANKLQRPNMVRGLFRDIIGSPRLAAASTRRYMFADPNIAAAIVVAYLEGMSRGPIMESREGWRIDGVEWKVTQYAKAQVADPKAAVTNAGA